MLKLVGALFILAGAGGIGHLMALGLEDRAVILRRLLAALQHLESEIVFACSPMPLALARAGRSVGGEVGAFLREVAGEVERRDGPPLDKAWTRALERYGLELLLTPAEVETLLALGAVLGGSDREDQRKHLELARAAMTRFQGEAAAQAAKNKRVWQYLGFSLGALAVVFLY